MHETYVTNDQLIKEFLSPSMENYFYKKLKGEDSKYIKLKICELLKYLILSQHSLGNIPFSQEIDEIWHYWILQTVQYQELTIRLPGRSFIHHSSNDYVDENKDDIIAILDEKNRQFSYLVSYIANFGKFTTEAVRFWPLANDLMDIMGFNLDMLNNYLCDTSRQE